MMAEHASERDPIEEIIGIWADDGPAFDARDLDEELAREHEERFD